MIVALIEMAPVMRNFMRAMAEENGPRKLVFYYTEADSPVPEDPNGTHLPRRSRPGHSGSEGNLRTETKGQTRQRTKSPGPPPRAAQELSWLLRQCGPLARPQAV